MAKVAPAILYVHLNSISMPILKDRNFLTPSKVTVCFLHDVAEPIVQPRSPDSRMVNYQESSEEEAYPNDCSAQWGVLMNGKNCEEGFGLQSRIGRFSVKLGNAFDWLLCDHHVVILLHQVWLPKMQFHASRSLTASIASSAKSLRYVTAKSFQSRSHDDRSLYWLRR